MRKQLLTIVFLLVTVPAFAGRTVTSFPATEDFSGANSIADLIWAANGATVTRVQQSWRGGSDYCVKITPPTRIYGPQSPNGGYAALGRWENFNQPIITIAFAMKVGSTFYATSVDSGGGYQNKFIDVHGVGGVRTGILTTQRCGTQINEQFGVFQAHTSQIIYYNNCSNTGVKWRDGSSDYANQWIFINYTLDKTSNLAILRVWDQNGNFTGTNYISTPSNVTVNHTDFYIGGYYNRYHPNADINTYILIDDITLTNSAYPVNPPTGFISSLEEPKGLKVQ